MKSRDFIRSRGRIAWSVGAIIWAGCGSTTDPLNAIDVGLPARTIAVDTSGVSSDIRLNGGNVFVKLTGEPTAASLDVLSRAGLQPPILPDHPTTIVTFPDLNIATVAGHVDAGGVRRIAILHFVIRIEASSGDTIVGAALKR